jgi:hypothetical protein
MTSTELGMVSPPTSIAAQRARLTLSRSETRFWA